MNYEEKLQIIQAGCPKLRFSAQFTDQSSQWKFHLLSSNSLPRIFIHLSL